MGNRAKYSQIRSFSALCSSYPFALYSDLCDFSSYLQAVINAGSSELLLMSEVKQCGSKSDEASLRVWLPQGEWISLFCKKEYSGRTHTAKTEKIPVYYHRGEEPKRIKLCNFTV